MASDRDETLQAETLARALSATSRRAVARGPLVPEHPLTAPENLPHLEALAKDALSAAIGTPVAGNSAFPLTVWQHGASHVGKSSPGVRFTGSVDTFLSVLKARSIVTAPKGTGWVVEPTTNVDGRRTNESTTHMHAVFLDCDDCGDWSLTLSSLSQLGLAHVAYQSGGHTDENPKWRVVLPLSSPYPVRNDVERSAWKKFYHRVRVLVGAVGHLDKHGFDPRTDAPSIPFFLLERRVETDPIRLFSFQPGAALDAGKFALVLPVVSSDEERERDTPRTPRKQVVQGEGDEYRHVPDEALDAFVAALATATNSVPAGRRDLYLALPGALLDRGLSPDDVLHVCTEVSLAYPRRHEDKHRDNVHSCKTTVGKYKAGDSTYTRIGTLQATFPDVAKVVDEHLADEEAEALAHAVSNGIALSRGSIDAFDPDDSTPIPPPLAAPQAPVTTAQKKHADGLRKKLEKIAEENEKDKPARALARKTLKHVIDHGIEAFTMDSMREAAIKHVFGLVGFELPDVTFDEVVPVLRVTRKESFHLAAAEYAKAQIRKKKWDAGAAAREEKNRAENEANMRQIQHMYDTGLL